MFGPIQSLSGMYRTLRTASVSIDQVFSILDHQDSLGDAPDAIALPRVRGEVEFEDVTFVYGRRATDKPLIDGVTLRVKAGENVALVGPSGAGKSTLMALLCRFYDPVRGAVRIDGHDLRQVKQKSLRQQLGIVFQDTLLFNESVRANIAYGKPDSTFDEIVEAAKAAHAHEFISKLPQGYETQVGERGALLSAGERQRIAIARSLLLDPPLLVLDEPTSALDAESEALVQDALARLIRGRTTFAVAHRLSTVVGADRIVVLKDGRIAEEGTHAELMKRGGYYASLVRLVRVGAAGVRRGDPVGAHAVSREGAARNCRRHRRRQPPWVSRDVGRAPRRGVPAIHRRRRASGSGSRAARRPLDGGVRILRLEKARWTPL